MFAESDLEGQEESCWLRVCRETKMKRFDKQGGGIVLGAPKGSSEAHF